MKVEAKKRTIKISKGDVTFTAIISVLLILFFIITLYPMIYVLSASFSDPIAVSSGRMILWPIEPSLDAYSYILRYKDIWMGYGNTLFYAVIGTACNLIVTLPCAYALSRKDMVGRGLIMMLFIITMYFSGGLIPSYLNMQSFGLLNTRPIMLISGLVAAYNLIIARTFFANSISWELHEAAFLDGCSDFRLFLRIVLPLSAPIIVVLMLYYGVSHWNNYFNAMIYLRDRSKYPLQVFLREILTLSQFSADAMKGDGGLSAAEMSEMARLSETADRIKYAIIVISTVPMLIVYPCVQKYFAKGVMIGSVKG